MTKQKPKPETLITVIGPKLYQPIADLVGRLIARPYNRGDRIGSNYFEVGYCSSIIVLLCTVVESLVQRDRYFLKQSNPSHNPANTVSEYAKLELKYRRYRRLEEFFVVRNAIAHNHMWEVEFYIPTEGGIRHISTKVVPGTHRIKSLPPVNVKIPRTNILKLHLSPNSLDRTDVKKILFESVLFLDHIAKKGNNPVNLTDHQVGLLKRRVRFSELSEEL